MNCHRNNTGNASVTELVTEKADKPLKRSDLDRRLLASSAPHAAETGTTFRMALVLILKLNKEAPLKKDVFRAPGHQGNMKKLIHFLQTGRLVNIDNFSVYTIASVLKKFLRKLPGGIFGRTNEQQLFTIVQMNSITQQRDEIYKLISSLPPHTQRLLVLLFGTFRVIATNAERAHTGMTAEALGVSVAPSFFQSCVSDGKTAKMEDVLRYKVSLVCVLGRQLILFTL
ncbi:hypothetical protein J6590_045421 [Homalodisca vitripennis]|nr:hypothetical protein J6590_045421 [Homalodisca vitripennis]